MILNEFVEDYFNNKELQNITKASAPQDKYNSLSSEIMNPYNNQSNVLDFSIRGSNENEYLIKLSGIIDYTNSQFVIKKVSTSVTDEDKVDAVKRILNSVIINLESQHPEIDVIFWRINKNDVYCLKACTDSGFTYQDSNSFSMELTYYLASSAIRQSNNSTKVYGMIDN